MITNYTTRARCGHLERTGLEIAILATALLASLHFHWEENKKSILEPRIELGTSCVLGMRDNQLHHPSQLLGFSKNGPSFFSCSFFPVPAPPKLSFRGQGGGSGGGPFINHWRRISIGRPRVADSKPAMDTIHTPAVVAGAPTVSPFGRARPPGDLNKGALTRTAVDAPKLPAPWLVWWM